MRIAVIGSRGYLGSHVAAALGALEWTEVLATARHAAPGALRVDLTDPTTFDALRDADWIVNCADSVSAPPDQLIEWTLREGGRLIEAAADTMTVRRLLARHRPDAQRNPDTGPDTDTEAQGTVILGGGLFPGLSNLAAADAVRRLGADTPAERLRVMLLHSPVSGAGLGTCRLMIAALGVGLTSVGTGRAPGDDRPFRRLGRVRLAEAEHRAFEVGFPETDMLRMSLRIEAVDTAIALRPRLVGAGASATGPLIAHLPGPARRVIEFAMLPVLRVARAGVLRGRPARVVIAAVASGADGRQTRVEITTDDGFRCAGATIAAMLGALHEQTTPIPPGMRTPDEAFELDPITERIGGLDEELELTVWSEE